MPDTTQPTPTSPDADVVADGVAALRCFGEDLDLASAVKLLSMWKHNSTLDSAERAAILGHFGGTATEQPAPMTHPVWCDRSHPDGWPVHGAHFGAVEIAEGWEFQVELTDHANGKGPSVTLVEHLDDETIVREVTAEQARDLGRWLTAAADVLDAAGQVTR